LCLILAAGLAGSQAAEQKEKDQQPPPPKQNQRRGNQGQGQGQGQGSPNRPYPTYPGLGPGNPGSPRQGNPRDYPQLNNPNRSTPKNPGRIEDPNATDPKKANRQAEPREPRQLDPKAAPKPVEPKQADLKQPETRKPTLNQPSTGNQTQKGGRDSGGRRDAGDIALRNPPAPERPPMKEVKNAKGDIEQRSEGGRLRGVTKVDTKSGEKRSQQISATGRIEREQVVRPDGTSQTRELDLGNREKRVTTVRGDRRETTDVHYDRTGGVRSRETVVVNNNNRVVSRTVVVKKNFVVRNTTVVNVHSTRHYAPCHWGYVYHPVFVAPAFYIGWYDPFWYGPVHHHFTFSWGWHAYPWYHYDAYYWQPYPVYAAPSYWVTDWMVAGYAADRYAVATSIEQTREEVRLAREEAQKARLAAEEAKTTAEIAEAKAAQAQAEARAERAEARVAKAQVDEERRKALGDKPNPNTAPITQETKNQLKDQVEQTIAEKKALAEKGENAVSPDVTAALKDPKHVYPVSKNLSVIRADDNKPAGTLTPGDLLKVEPGQENALKDANEGTLVHMRVITSRGEDDSVPAGTVVVVPLKELQEFDNEFRAKVDLGLAEADKNKDEFKTNASVAQ
jgi:hypothetical protein